MKHIYLTIIALGFAGLTKAQTLTAAANEPTVGDLQTMKGYDSTGVVPKATGTAQSWNFSSFAQNATVTTASFTTPVGTPNASVFVGATLAENDGGGNYNYWKSVTSPTPQYEMLGTTGGAFTYYYSNSAIMSQWPISFGYSVTDTYSGNISGAASGTLNGNVTTLGSGTGTLTMPGGQIFTNILQVKTLNTVTMNITIPSALNATIVGTDYNYYHSSQKFPLLTVSYQATSGFTNYATAIISANTAVYTGLNEKNFDAAFQIFPNPAKDAFNVDLVNADNENGKIEIYNSIGQMNRSINLGNESAIKRNISLEGMAPGIYMVKTSLGSRTSMRRLIIE
jgi:hypothetical protein